VDTVTAQSAAGRPPFEPLRYASAPGRWALAAVILGSGAAFLEPSVVTVALPAIGRDLGLELGGLQWVMNAYLLALSALIITVTGGALVDLYGRRIVLVVGLIGFAVMSPLCGLAPSGEGPIAVRVLQGVAAALLVPASLAIVESSFAEDDRAKRSDGRLTVRGTLPGPAPPASRRRTRGR
jgi:MFS family permease